MPINFGWRSQDRRRGVLLQRRRLGRLRVLHCIGAGEVLVEADRGQGQPPRLVIVTGNAAVSGAVIRILRRRGGWETLDAAEADVCAHLAQLDRVRW
jgi:hypothetical protein